MRPPRFPSTSIPAVVSDVDGTLMTDDKRLTPRAQAVAPGPGEAPITVAIEPQPREVVAQILSSLAIAEDVRTL
jgi:hypothetical protein